MTMRTAAFISLFCLLALAACGPGAAPGAGTPSAAPTQPPTSTTAPTFTPRPSDTPIPPAATATAGTPAAGTPGATQPAAGGNPPAGGKAPEQYTYLGQTIPDRSQFPPNRVVTITWTVQNSGTIGWTKDYTLRHFAGPAPDQSAYAFSKDVPVNDTINFTVTFTTPSSPGDYDIWFKLTNNAGQNFGDLDFLFTVSNSPAAGTSTPAQ
jgi:hypothetical protein